MQGIYVTCGRSSCIGRSPSALAPNPPAATVIQRKRATTPVAAAAMATAMRGRFAHRRLRVLETRWTTSPERRFPPLTNRLPCRVRSGNLSATRSLAATHALVVFKSLLLVVVAIPADLCGPNAAELRPPWPPPLGCHWRSLARWTRQQMPSSSSSRFFSSLSPFPQTYTGPNAAELSIKAPYEALIQTASGFETKLSAI